jgi:hypothetical protein
MGVEVSNYCTTSFILKDDESVEYIKKFCKLLTDESNLGGGYLSDDAYCDIHPYSKEERSFIIKAGGFMDASPELLASALSRQEGEEPEEVDEDEFYDEDRINLWFEIQKHLKEDTWFFVDEYSWGRSYATTSVSFYHQNGKTQYLSNYEIKKDMLKKMGI